MTAIQTRTALLLGRDQGSEGTPLAIPGTVIGYEESKDAQSATRRMS